MPPAALTAPLSPLQFPWVIYALGQTTDPGLNQSFDSFDRAIALANVAAVTRQVFLLTNSTRVSSVQAHSIHSNLSIQRVSPDATEPEVVDQVTQLLSIAPFILVVDALPTGSYGELVSMLSMLPNVPKVLVLQDFKTEDIIAKNIEHLIQNHYDLGIVPGTGEGTALAYLQNVVQTGPWLGLAHLLKAPDSSDPDSSDPDVKPDVKQNGAIALQTAALAEGSEATVLVLSSDNPNELDTYSHIANVIAQQCPWVTVRLLSSVPPAACDLELWESYHPATDYILAVDLVIGDGSYTTVHLCDLLKTPLIAFPWSRPNNLQQRRLERMVDIDDITFKVVTSTEEALCQAFNFLNQGIERAAFSPQKRWQNLSRIDELNALSGVKVGVRLIEEAIINKWDQVAQTAMLQDIDRLRQSR